MSNSPAMVKKTAPLLMRSILLKIDEKSMKFGATKNSAATKLGSAKLGHSQTVSEADELFMT